MILLSAPWSIFLFVGILLVALFLKEAHYTFVMHPGNPERPIAWFNSLVILGVVVVVVLCGCYFFVREQQIAVLTELYPNARYAPEREVFAKGSDWIFVTSDTTREITAFYRLLASTTALYVTFDESGETTKILLSKDAHMIFLTIENTGERRVLYYGSEGKLEIVLPKTASSGRVSSFSEKY
jgi:hypothetical protein